MDKCAHCEKPIERVAGRRPRLYCSIGCRQKAFQAKRKKGLLPLPADYGCMAHIGVVKDGNVKPLFTEFMGVQIPPGLNGIDLAIWKEEIRGGKR